MKIGFFLTTYTIGIITLFNFRLDYFIVMTLLGFEHYALLAIKENRIGRMHSITTSKTR